MKRLSIIVAASGVHDVTTLLHGVSDDPAEQATRSDGIVVARDEVPGRWGMFREEVGHVEGPR